MRTVILALWLGALLAIDIIETPVRVSTSTVPRAYRFAIGARVFNSFAWVQVSFGVVLTTLAMVSARQTGVDGRLQLHGAVTVLLLTLLQAIWLGPSMSNRMAVRESQNTVELDLRPGFKTFHYLYIAADAVKALVLIYLIFKIQT